MADPTAIQSGKPDPDARPPRVPRPPTKAFTDMTTEELAAADAYVAWERGDLAWRGRAFRRRQYDAGLKRFAVAIHKDLHPEVRDYVGALVDRHRAGKWKPKPTVTPEDAFPPEASRTVAPSKDILLPAPARTDDAPTPAHVADAFADVAAAPDDAAVLPARVADAPEPGPGLFQAADAAVKQAPPAAPPPVGETLSQKTLREDADARRALSKGTPS